MIIMRSWCPVISFDMMTMMSLRASTSKHHLSFLVLLCLCIVCASVLVILILICPQNSVTKRKAEEMKKEKNLFSSFFKLRYLTQARMQLDINSRYGLFLIWRELGMGFFRPEWRSHEGGKKNFPVSHERHIPVSP